MSDAISDSIPALYNLVSCREKDDIFTGLRETARELWKSYENEQIKHNHDSELTQIVYLLRYYFLYANPIGEILKRLKTKNLPQNLEYLLSQIDSYFAIFRAEFAPNLLRFLYYIKKKSWCIGINWFGNLMDIGHCSNDSYRHE